MNLKTEEQIVLQDDLNEAAAAMEHALILCGGRIVDEEVWALLSKANQYITNMLLYVPDNGEEE